MPPSRPKPKGSPAFARIKREVIELTLKIPPGRVASYADMGRVLAVMPRHVAYILATLSPEEEALIPWYRTVSATGRLLNPANRQRAVRQAELLRAEGVPVSPAGAVPDLARVLFHLL